MPEIKIEPGKQKFFTLSEFRREVGIPLILAKRLIVWGEISAVRAVDGTLHIAHAEVAVAKKLLENRRKKMQLFLRTLGPG